MAMVMATTQTTATMRIVPEGLTATTNLDRSIQTRPSPATERMTIVMVKRMKEISVQTASRARTVPVSQIARTSGSHPGCGLAIRSVSTRRRESPRSKHA